MSEYIIDHQGAELMENLILALEEVYEATEHLAQYVAKEHSRDRYRFLDKLAHCSDYYTVADDVAKCFYGLSQNLQREYFRI